MNRLFACVLAVLCATVSVSSACLAQSPDLINFTLQLEHKPSGKIHASFRHEGREQYDNSWSTGFMPSDLIGMEVSSFLAPGTKPLHFSIVREAGRLDCAGTGGGSYASGNCRFTADPGFTRLLASRGIGQPTRDQAFGLMAVNARRELIQALAAARYPTPTLDNLMALSALRVDEGYIAGMSRAGYRPATLQSLIQFKALGITPDYIQGFERIGYRDLPVSKLVQLKALKITPEFVRSAVGEQKPLPPVSELVDRKMLAKRR
jgi:hypothetical protein